MNQVSPGWQSWAGRLLFLVLVAGCAFGGAVGGVSYHEERKQRAGVEAIERDAIARQEAWKQEVEKKMRMALGE